MVFHPLTVTLRPHTRRAALWALVAVLCAGGLALASRDGGGRPSFDIHTETFEGEVAEVLEAGNYTYFALVDQGGVRRWVVTPGGQYRGATRLRVRSFGRRHGFESERLRRRFDDLYFVSVLEPESPSP